MRGQHAIEFNFPKGGIFFGFSFCPTVGSKKNAVTRVFSKEDDRAGMNLESVRFTLTLPLNEAAKCAKWGSTFGTIR